MNREQSGSEKLLRIIRERIEERGDRAISFCEYMDLCLYHPDYGYYMKEKTKIGRDGDFYTSASIGSLLGEILAEHVRSIAPDTQSPFWLTEWGGGSGILALHVLNALKLSSPDLYDRLQYVSIEASPYHRKLQAETLADHAGRVRWLKEDEWVKEGPWNDSVVFSNELADALPVHRIAYREDGWLESFVTWDDAAQTLTEREMPLTDRTLREFVTKERMPQREGQRFEVGLAAVGWLKKAAEGLGQRAEIITIDYGDAREELYAPHRMNGTLLCYRKHQAYDMPLLYPGEQDMTSHVNFSALIDVGRESGLGQYRFMTQKQFLVENGLLTGLQQHDALDPFSPAAKRNRAIRQLLLSDQMSELFKVLVQKKGEPLS
ncbi:MULTISPECIES: SAM-dependent methyltransferase [unclassified Paenibacillus]|uniref:class I SAM-dependent methyltransferase n=1 Tax=unclassified Paenibacillus TaxID=185978 RepID=UPI001AE1DCB2|nr:MULTISPECIES: SAM-dependent methyltransferase [unclassified Paenibacillus]MBP1156295.1 SAM-dependent MidA family methyltransferase [Paenibacillus sp. PvP091]MBP1168319.1 SAM-dependent MidA family methyltransferase [Paenibacillus sp. PvR098]MBP2439347.1 SAM-dependent MidA family methyltransferase [Paenibacillus sp. PvP052]